MKHVITLSTPRQHEHQLWELTRMSQLWIFPSKLSLELVKSTWREKAPYPKKKFYILQLKFSLSQVSKSFAFHLSHSASFFFSSFRWSANHFITNNRRSMLLRYDKRNDGLILFLHPHSHCWRSLYHSPLQHLQHLSNILNISSSFSISLRYLNATTDDGNINNI